MIPKEQKIQELQSLLRQDKFLAEKEGLYTGVADDQLRGVLTDTINISIHSFISITDANGSDEDYRKAIAEGLASLESIKSVIDTEDNERVCHYFELMMDAVQLDSSEGLLNTWLYGFNPG